MSFFKKILLQGAIWGIIAVCVGTLHGQSVATGPTTNEIRVVEFYGTVEVSMAGTTTWQSARVNQMLHPFDRLRSGANSRGALLWSDNSVVPFGASTELEILPPQSNDAQSGLHLIQGIISFSTGTNPDASRSSRAERPRALKAPSLCSRRTMRDGRRLPSWTAG